MSKIKKKVIIIISAIVVLLLVIAGVLFFKKQTDKKEETQNNFPQIVLNEAGVPKFVDGQWLNTKVSSEDDVFTALNEVKEMYDFDDASKEFNILTSETNSDYTYYRLEQKYKGIALYNHQLVVAVDNNGNVTSLTGDYIPNIQISTTYQKTEKQVKEMLSNTLTGEYEILDSARNIYIQDGKAILSYVFSIIEPNGYYDLIVSSNGTIIDKISKIYNEAYDYTGLGVKDTEYSITLDKSVLGYKFRDPNRNIDISDGSHIEFVNNVDTFTNMTRALYMLLKLNVFNNPIVAGMKDGKLEYNVTTMGGVATINNEEVLKNAITTMANFEKTYDYYEDVLGRKSFDGKGGKISVAIGIGLPPASFLGPKREWVNASYMGDNGFVIGSYNNVPMSYALDVVGHEFTHGVIDYTAGLIYSGESGALNESYADIFGSLIEDKNFEIGEDVIRLRNFADPNEFEDPKIKDDKYYFPTDKDTYNQEWLEKAGYIDENGNVLPEWQDWDNGGVHTNSNVSNHAAYLMYSRNAFKDKEEMAKVYYNSLYLMTPTSNFEDCALSVIQSARQLGLANDKIAIIVQAFVETKMFNRDYVDLSGYVYDDDTHEPLSDVIVTAINKLNPNVYFEVVTAKDGSYHFDQILADDYTISFEKAKYQLLEKDANLEKSINDFTAYLIKAENSDIKKSEIIFVMDISMSMDTSDPNDFRKQIISNVLLSLDSNANVALVTFTTKANVINDGLSNRNVDRKILATDVFNIKNDNGHSSGSGTNGRAGLEKALELFTDEKDVRRYIVHLTDGADTITYGGKSYDELVEEAKAMNVRILAIGLGSDDDIDEDELIKMAEGTNGKYYHATDSTKLFQFDKRIFEELE